jgi:NAD(P)-dependent dehydrogenase (short-subunit alcohol dehydrogenase family)
MSIILVTGSTDGIGLETAKELAALGHEMVLHGRSKEKVQRAREAVHRTAPDAVLHTAHADLTDFDAIRRMAQDLAARLPRLDALINNAGVYMNKRRLTKDGFETTLAVNYLAPFLLTRLLLPLLKKSPGPRVVTVSSIAHQSGDIAFDNLNSERRFDAYKAYADSKLADALFAAELARREPWLASNSLHPGVIDTKLLHAGFDMKGEPVTEGAQTPVFLAASPAVRGITGKYFDNRTAVRPSAQAEDEQLARQLWEWTEEVLRPWLPA